MVRKFMKLVSEAVLECSRNSPEVLKMWSGVLQGSDKRSSSKMWPGTFKKVVRKQ